MSERINNVSGGVIELPLFPLEMVLFPGIPVPLHIFEERYKEMVDVCVREERPFGIVLVTGNDENTGRATTESIGCRARITHVERLPQGRLNIEILGEERFHILDTHEQESYRVGLVEAFQDREESEASIEPLVDEVQRLLHDFLSRTLEAVGQDIPEFELPEDPAVLSFTAAWVLPVGTEQKQALLAENHTAVRLKIEREVLLREVTRLRRAAESRQVVWSPVKLEAFADYVSTN